MTSEKRPLSWIPIDKYKMPLAAMACITVMEMVALFQGVNGVTLTTAVGAVAGIGGYMSRKMIEKE